MDPNIFVPSGPGGTLKPALDICNGRDGLPECPVKKQCKEFGDATNSLGVFGGEVRSSRTWRATAVHEPIEVLVYRPVQDAKPHKRD
jgi:hypothetical protein